MCLLGVWIVRGELAESLLSLLGVDRRAWVSGLEVAQQLVGPGLALGAVGCSRVGPPGERWMCGMELTRLRGHIILELLLWGSEARMGRPSKYPAEFRREALELVRSSPDRTVADIARALGLNEGTLGNWVREQRDRVERDADPNALSEPERDELKRLRKRNAQLEIDNQILSKAAAYFARETNR